MILGGLTGRAQAGVNAPGMFAGYGDVRPTPTFVPSPQGVGPMIPGVTPGLPTPNLPPIATPGDIGSSSLALPPSAPVDITRLLEQARAQAAGILGPEQAPAAPRRGAADILSKVFELLSQSVAASLSRDPGGAMMDFQRQALALKQNEIERKRQDQERRQQLTAQIFNSSVNDATIERRQRDADARLNERQFQADIRDDQRAAANQAAMDYRAELKRIDDDAKLKMAEQRALAEQERKDLITQEKDIRLQANTFIDDFKIPRAQAIRFSRYEITGTPLSAADQKVYDRIEKYRPQDSSGGGSGGGRGGVGTAGVNQKLAQFEIMKGQLGAAMNRGDAKAEAAIRAKLDALAAKMPSNVETGYDPTGVWPYAKIRGTNPGRSTPAPGATATAAESPARAAARAKLKANGYSDAEATSELDRLGVR